MEIKCGDCGKKTIVNKKLIKSVIGGGMIILGGWGWVTYLFAGLLGFSGGAALIAIALITGGSAVLIGKDLNLVISIGQKIADFMTDRNYPCPSCEATNWQFSGYKGVDIIAGDEHTQELWIALRDAKKELCIASGFLSSNVVNEHFVQELESALVRKVSVFLIFADVRSHGSDWMKQGYDEALSKLSKLAEKYQHLALRQKHTHQKGIVVDDKYAIIGSFNFLSNKKIDRKETSSKVYESKAISEFKLELLKE